MSHVLRGFPYPGTTRQQSGRQGHWKSLWDRVSIDHLLQDLPPDLPTCWGVPCLSRKVTASQKIIWEITISLPSGNLFYFLEVRCLLLCYWEKEDLAMFSLLLRTSPLYHHRLGQFTPLPQHSLCASHWMLLWLVQDPYTWTVLHFHIGKEKWEEMGWRQKEIERKWGRR